MNGSTEIHVIAWVMAVPFWLLVPFSFQTFYRYRHVHPVNGRGMAAIFCQFSVIYMAFSVLFLEVVLPSFPCWLFLALRTFLLLAIQHVFIYRLALLTFAFEVSKNIREQTPGNPFKPNWFSRHVSFFQLRRLVSWPITLALTNLVFNASILSLQPDFLANQKCSVMDEESTFWGMNVFFLSIFFPGVALLFALCYRLHKFGSDNFFLKTEMLLVLLSAAVCILAIVATQLLGAQPEVSSLILGLFFHLVHIISLVLPAWKAHKEVHYLKNYKSDDISLATCLGTEVGMEAFAEFLESEFSSENLCFWRAVEQLRKRLEVEEKPDWTEIMAELATMYERFLDANAAYQVNISSKQKQTAKDNLVTVLSLHQTEPTEIEKEQVSQVFQAAQTEVFNLMEQDSFRRFCRTAAFKTLTPEIATQKRHGSSARSGLAPINTFTKKGAKIEEGSNSKFKGISLAGMTGRAGAWEGSMHSKMELGDVSRDVSSHRPSTAAAHSAHSSAHSSPDASPRQSERFSDMGDLTPRWEAPGAAGTPGSTSRLESPSKEEGPGFHVTVDPSPSPPPTSQPRPAHDDGSPH
eukprot:g13497.t1